MYFKLLRVIPPITPSEILNLVTVGFILFYSQLEDFLMLTRYNNILACFFIILFHFKDEWKVANEFSAIHYFKLICCQFTVNFQVIFFLLAVIEIENNVSMIFPVTRNTINGTSMADILFLTITFHFKFSSILSHIFNHLWIRSYVSLREINGRKYGNRGNLKVECNE